MSRAVTVGPGQRFKSQSKRISSRGEVCCWRSGFGGGSSANENCSPLVCFGIGVFPIIGGSLWGQGTGVDYQLFVAAQVDRDDHAIGVGAGFLVAGAGSCAELLCGFNAVTRTGALVFQDSSEHCRGFGKLFGGSLASCVSIEHPAFTFCVDCEAQWLVLDNFVPVGVGTDLILFSQLIVRKNSLAISGAVCGERTSDVAVQRN